jgi:phthiocerol/phenolphthiocerol synthesis type-I polyketide synthase E
LCAVNEPQACVVGGRAEDVRRLLADLEGSATQAQLLATPHAFHTSFMTEAAERFREHLRGLSLRPPRIPMLSGTTGSWMTREEATDPARWADQIRRPVRFGAVLERLLTGPARILVEVGPGRALTGMARRSPAWSADHRAVALTRHPQQGGDDLATLLLGLGRLWCAGVDLEPHRLGTDDCGSARRIPLPGYPFRHDEHWIPSPVPGSAHVAQPETARSDDDDAGLAVGRSGPDPSPGPGTDGVGQLSAIWQDVLGVTGVGPDDDFFALGGDSVTAIQVAAAARRVGLVTVPQDVFRYPTPALLGRYLSAAQSGAARAAPSAAAAPAPDEPPLTPSQTRVLRFGRDADRFVIPISLLLAPDTRAALPDALARLAQRHPMLRLRTFRYPGGWAQRITPAAEAVDLVEVRQTDVRGSAALATELGRSITLDGEGPLWRCARLTGHPDGFDRLVLVFHHFLMDQTGQALLLDDLADIVIALRSDAAPPPLRGGTSWSAWAQEVARCSGDPVVLAERAYWLADERICHRPAFASPATPGCPAPGDLGMVTQALDRSATATLLALQRRTHVPLERAVLAATVLALERVTGAPGVLVDVQGSGRNAGLRGTDVSTTVGWFTTSYPVLLTGGRATLTRALEVVGDTLAEVPREGLGYGVLRELHAPSAPALASVPAAELTVVHLTGPSADLEGPDRVLVPDPSSAGPIRSVPACLGHAVEVRSYLDGDTLRLDWWFDSRRVSREFVTALSEHVSAVVREDLDGSRGAHPGLRGPDGLTSLSAHDLGEIFGAS